MTFAPGSTLGPYAIQAELGQRFLQEAQAASALDHPNICTIHEINETEDAQLYPSAVTLRPFTCRAVTVRSTTRPRRARSSGPWASVFCLALLKFVWVTLPG